MEDPRQFTGKPNEMSGEENYYGNTPRMRGDTGRIPVQRPQGQTGRIPTQRPQGQTGRIPTQRPPQSRVDRTPVQRTDAMGGGMTGRIPTQRPQSGYTGRIPTQRRASEPYAPKARVNPANPHGYTTKDEPDPNETGTLKITERRRREAQAAAAAAREFEGEEAFENELGVTAEEEGFMAKLAMIPPKKLAAAGVIVTVILVAIILLVVLIPHGEKVTVTAPTPTPVFEATPTPTMNVTLAPVATQHPLATPLQFGMQADIVADIQQRLIDLGYMDYPVVDGVEQVTTSYGRVTKQAVQTFQQHNGLTSDGWCGQGTFDLLMSDDAKPFTVKRGEKGAMVTKLQKRLKELGFFNSPVGDTAGPDTVNAIKAFQAANGLDADGQAGAKTLDLIYSDNAVNKDGRAVAMPSAAQRAEAEPATTEVEIPTVEVEMPGDEIDTGDYEDEEEAA